MHATIDWLVKCVEVAGAALVAGGVLIALFRVVRVPFMQHRPPLAALQIRLGLGMFLALGLEFQLASDVLRTAVAPTFDEIAQLAAIAGIRTALNFFLGREFVEGQRQIDAITAAHLDARATGPPATPRSGRPAATTTGQDCPSEGEADPPPGADSGDAPAKIGRRPLGEALRAAVKGPLWIPELPHDSIVRGAPAEPATRSVRRDTE